MPGCKSQKKRPSPSGAKVNSPGREPWDQKLVLIFISPEGAADGCRPSGATERAAAWFQGLTPLAT
jgi:hypothetical protein